MLPLLPSLVCVCDCSGSVLQHASGGGGPAAAGAGSHTPTDTQGRPAAGWEHPRESTAPPSTHRATLTHTLQPPPTATATCTVTSPRGGLLHQDHLSRRRLISVRAGGGAQDTLRVSNTHTHSTRNLKGKLCDSFLIYTHLHTLTLFIFLHLFQNKNI